MHQESTPSLEPEAVEGAILAALLAPGEQRPWSVGEIEREFGKSDVEDALAHLHGAGLVHRCGELVFVTRAAVAAQRLDL